MRYIIAGYVFVLTLLFLYAVSLAWRRRRLARAVARVTADPPADPSAVTAAYGSAAAVHSGGDR
jgi:hypothetical protein